MPFVPAPGVAQVNMVFATVGGEAENVYHVHRDAGGPWTLDELSAMVNVFSDWEQATGRHQRANNIHCIECRIRDLTTADALETAVGGNSFGDAGGNAAPDNVTVAVKKNTGHVGRSFRGRTYWVGTPLGKVSGDSVDGTWLTAVVAALDTLHDNVNAVAGFHLCLLRSQLNGVLLNPREEAPISSFSSVDQVIDSQRRRLPGRGR